MAAGGTIQPASRRAFLTGLREVWGRRELGAMLGLRDLQLRYRQTFFGIAWAVLQPLAAVLAFSVVFGRIADVPSDGLPYPVFALAGLTVWIYVSGAVSAASESLVAQAT